MTADEFSGATQSVIPILVNRWLGRGRDKKTIESLASDYECRRIYPTLEENIDPLVDLAQSFDTKRLSIGSARIADGIRDYIDYWILGYVDVDYLCMDKVNGEIRVYEYSAMYHCLWECAVNGAAFLDAAYEILCASYVDLSQSERCDLSYKCADIAGGDKYLKYWKTEAGCDS